MSPEAVGNFMLLSSATSAVTAGYVVRRRHAVASRSLIAILVFAAIWALFYGLELMANDPDTKQMLGNIKYLGVVFVPPSWLVFTIRSTGRGRWVTIRTVVLLLIEPVLVLGLLAIPSTQELVRYYPEPPLDPFPIVKTGPLFWINAIYLNLLTFTATALFLITLSRHTPQYRRQRSWLAFAFLLPWVPNVSHNLGIGPLALVDLTPVALSISGPIMVWGFFRSRLLDLAPVARRHIVDSMPDGVLVLDAFLRVVDHNPASDLLLNLNGHDPIGIHIAQLLPSLAASLQYPAISGPYRMSIPQILDEDKALETPARILEVEATSLDGDTTPSYGRSPGYLLIVRDATERLANEERLQRLAHHDALTGLPNRKLFAERLEFALARGRRHNHNFALLFIDLDRFKVVNDTLGHETGDVLLQQVADRLQHCLRQEDTLARIGGDEFIVLIANIDHKNDAQVVANKLLNALECPFHVNEQILNVTASIGVSRFPTNGTNAHQLMTRADSAMYLAKAEGKNRVHLADNHRIPQSPFSESGTVGFENELHSALDNDELDMDFQACFAVDKATAKRAPIILLEALVRWPHPERGLIPPEVFIPHAEEGGFMPALGLWVLERACRQVALWRDEYGLDVNVAVNISPAQLGHHLLARHAGQAIAGAGLEPRQLILEISERSLVVESSPLISELEALRDTGVQLALDDFGTGDTSLGRLKRLQFNQLKIDKEFIRNLTTNPDNKMIVGAMVNLGHSLDMKVIAEGVESDQELDALSLLGCDAAQGFLFGPPLSSEETTAMLLRTVDRTPG